MYYYDSIALRRPAIPWHITVSAVDCLRRSKSRAKLRLAIGLIVSASTVVGPRCPWFEGLKKFMETALMVASYNPAELVSLRANEIQ